MQKQIYIIHLYIRVSVKKAAPLSKNACYHLELMQLEKCGEKC